MKRVYTYLVLLCCVFGATHFANAQDIENAATSAAIADSRISACNVANSSDTLKVTFAIDVNGVTTMQGGSIQINLDSNIFYVGGSLDDSGSDIPLSTASVDGDNVVVVELDAGVTPNLGDIISFTIGRRLEACSRPFSRPLRDQVSVLTSSGTLANATGDNPFQSNPYNQDFPQLTASNASVTNNNTVFTDASIRTVQITAGSGELSRFEVFEVYPTGTFTYEANSFAIDGTPVAGIVSDVRTGTVEDTIVFTITQTEIALMNNTGSDLDLLEDGESVVFSYNLNWVNCSSDISIASRIGAQYGCDGAAPCDVSDLPITSIQQTAFADPVVRYDEQVWTANEPTCPGDVVQEPLRYLLHQILHHYCYLIR